jgi:hypothetical protein
MKDPMGQATRRDHSVIPTTGANATGGGTSDRFALSVILTTGAKATGGRTSDSFVSTKPVPVSEIRAARAPPIITTVIDQN